MDPKKIFFKEQVSAKLTFLHSPIQICVTTTVWCARTVQPSTKICCLGDVTSLMYYVQSRRDV
jgi:hypothetical protein